MSLKSPHDLKGTGTSFPNNRRLTVWTYFADFLHVVSGAIVNGVSHPALGDGLVFGSRRCAKNGNIWHRLTQLGSRDTYAACVCKRQQ